MIKENLKKTFNEVKQFYNTVGKSKIYWISVLLCNITAYAFSMLNRSVSIDDLGQSIYYGSENRKIAGTRWGHVLLNRIFQTIEFTPFVDKFFDVLFIIISGFLFCCILNYLKKDNNILKYTIISCLWCTYPLIVECFEFREAMIIFADFVIMFLCVLYQLVNDEDFNIKNILFIGTIMSIVMAGYESVAFSYITVVFIILYLKQKELKRNWLLEGIRYAIPLVISLILRYAIGYILIWIVDTTYQNNGSTGIMWLSNGFKSSLVKVLYNLWYYVIRGLSYFPVTEFVVALLIYIAVIIKNQIKHQNSLLIGILLFISVFSLSFLQGNWLRYITGVPVNVFFVFVVYLLLENTKDVKKFKLNNVVIVLLLFLALRQSIYTHEILALNNQRSDNEAYIVQTIGYRLYSEFDISKPVIVCGEYQLGSFIEDQITIKEGSLADKVETYLRSLVGHEETETNVEYIYSNVNSNINWARHAMEGSMMKEYLSYYGYDIIVPEEIEGNEQEYLLRYEKIAQENDMKPLSIKDMGDYILVYLGKTASSNEVNFN